jgi:NAD(P)-dependent dehydrogenase (short-subunit alcohol dehydrogenase family)
MSESLADKVALITGAGSGIGAETARRMADAGAAVSLVGIPAEGVESVAADINDRGGKALALPTDVSDGAAMEASVKQTVESFGRLDIVVASAAVQMHNEDRTLHQMDDAIWDRTHDINYRGVYLTCKHALAQMVDQGDGGAIVIVSSVTAFSGSTANVSYASGKHGLIGLARHIGVHYAEHGIRCNAVCPGALEKTPNHDVHPDPEGRATRLEENIPLGRPGTPADIAPWIVFLATPDAGYATGAVFTIDGGLTVS